MSGRICATLLLFGALLAPLQGASDRLYPIREGRKFGFINRAGKIVVAPQYDAVGEEKEDRIRVTSGNLSAYMDLSCKVVIAPQYDSAGEFRESRAVVRQGGKYALIDPSGKHVAAIPYRVLGDFHQQLLRIQASGRVDAEGRRLPIIYGFADREGKSAVPPQFMPAGEIPRRSPRRRPR